LIQKETATAPIPDGVRVYTWSRGNAVVVCPAAELRRNPRTPLRAHRVDPRVTSLDCGCPSLTRRFLFR